MPRKKHHRFWVTIVPTSAFFFFLGNERIPACLIERSYFGYTMKIPLGMESCK
jgi:hypothetical protein